MGSIAIDGHVHEVMSVFDGVASRRDAVIQQSWKRCITAYGLDPTSRKGAYIVTDSELRIHRERIEELILTARHGVEYLYKRVTGLGYVVLLTDHKGVTVDYIGDSASKNELKKAGLYMGSEWNEERAGTNGVGSCIQTGEALIVHQSDHFDMSHVSLTCTAIPIYAATGELAAVLDISAMQSPEAKSSQMLAFQLVHSCVRQIETATLMRNHRRQWIIRFGTSPHFLDVDPEYALAVSDDGQIVGTTHCTLRYLARLIDVDWREPERVIGRTLNTFFSLDMAGLPRLAHQNPAEDRAIELINGGRIYAHAIAPLRPHLQIPQKRQIAAQLAALYGDEPTMEAVAEQGSKLAGSTINLLIQGATGTGKEFLARAIHESRQPSGPFVAINCAALPEPLIESELFGYAAGAFTGAASKGKKGLIVQADGGTLFLDEIGDMPFALQARLLRVLAEREVLPIGAATAIPVSIRVLSATHRDLKEQVKAGHFREDLYYRLNGAQLNLPELKHRQDFDWIVRQLLSAVMSKHDDDIIVADDAMRQLQAYSWPGNLRELANALEYALVICNNGVIQAHDLPAGINPCGAQIIAKRPLPPSGVAGPDVDLSNLLDELDWNVSAVARRLGVHRTTIHRRMNQLGIVPPNRQQA